MSLRSRAFVFTINNPTDNDRTDVRSLAECASYVICGDEVGAAGTPHLQGYVYFPSQRSRASVSKKLPRANLQVAKGTAEHNYKYCSKEKIFFEFGERPSQGSRSDLARTREEMAGMKMADIVVSARNLQSIRMAEKQLVYLEEKRTWKPFVVWFYGATGTGKSRGVHECFPGVFTPQSFKWWEGYDGHNEVLIDDFRADYCKFHDLLTLLDRYAYRVEFKGGSRQLRARVMCITSPYHPASVYNGRTDEDVQQLLRRIDRVVLVQRDSLGNEVHEIVGRS